jgi:hypothetical protein
MRRWIGGCGNPAKVLLDRCFVMQSKIRRHDDRREISTVRKKPRKLFIHNEQTGNLAATGSEKHHSICLKLAYIPSTVDVTATTRMRPCSHHTRTLAAWPTAPIPLVLTPLLVPSLPALLRCTVW